MRGLSFSQPWLWAVFDPAANKDIENRLGYQAPMELIDQPIACHAAKSYDGDGLHRLLELGYSPPQECLKSAIVGVATVARIVTSPKSLTPAQRRWYMGDDDGMRDGKIVYGHVLKDRRLLPTPIRWDGMLGFWRVPPLIKAEIAYQFSVADRMELDVMTGWVNGQAGYALRDYNGATLIEKLQRYVKLNPGVHVWFRLNDVESCAACALLRRDDISMVRIGTGVAGKAATKDKPCRGIVPLTIRGAA